MDGGALMRQRSVASIPSKFETILHEGGRENNAFWGRTHRFTYTDNEMPGAGQYFKAQNPERIAPSYSKKGYTGMVSKSSRFVPLRRATAPPPGTYDPTGGFKAITDKRDYSVVNYTSMFAKPIVAPDYIKGRRNQEVVEPGPGAYNVQGALLASNKQGKKLPFGTSTTRFKAKHAAGDLEEYAGPPPPGAYDPESMNKITGALQSLHTHVPSAAFNSRTGRKYDELRKSQDESLWALKPHPSMGPSLGIQVDIRSTSPSKALQPGPGYYEPYIADQLLTLDKIRHSSMFSRTNQDRFGRPLEKKSEPFVVPGPGTYKTGSKQVAKAQASMSSFVSTADRNIVGEPAVKGQPGPAYYNPAIPNKKSFHLNAIGRWV